ncbi:MAG: ABC transporter substrate-binding protein [Crenarchaeota archaeon]|nr:ABC transporter substrate-binding protein [Thermoproteota archaeon]MDA1123699.1 ABC transporter substrate-binding protein [Thermoproteota archaeon]HJJ21914.1 ABC transporter substrate-binding protein [Nitrosopumilus sp.]HJJ26208.1 ABC transporter substrate-binding protein [Nitrosopumilus sp.]
MKKMLVIILAISIIAITYNESFAEKNTFVNSIKFIQYLDENTALEEVKNGNLDMYYYRIPSDRLENNQSREGLKVYDSSGGSYSLLVNPAETEKINPFSSKDARFALNYLVDRKLIVNELMSGYGAPIISYYGPTDPEYITIIKELESFNFKYNPTLAEEIISKSMIEMGATKIDNKWIINNNEVEIRIFIRSDDPVRKSIGEILSVELEKIGFTVKKDYGDLNKAFVVVYGSNPADMKWNIYTEGWGRSAFVKYDSIGLGQMYSPWFSNMPGFNNPSYWNYENEKLDKLTQEIYKGDFETSEKRTQLIKEAVKEGINESVRIFLASKIDQYVVNENVEGVVNDLGAGVPSRFTPINVKTNDEELAIGVKQIYQGAWNPIMGLTDTYSRHIWGIISDPVSFKHPFTGETFPVRAEWKVETLGLNEKIKVPTESIMWNPATHQWNNVPKDTVATSKVTYDFQFSKWHNGETMDMNDILYSLYFTMEWGTQTDEKDKTFDTEFTPRAAQSIQTIIAVNQLDEDTVEVYVNYWHFDDNEIAEWAALWSPVPWEITAAMEKAVIDGKVSFSRSGATNKNVNWLSLIIPKDAEMIKEYLKEYKDSKFIPDSLTENQKSEQYYENRYSSSIKWIEKNKHAVISNGPFYLESYIPESRTITVKAFEDDTYPFKIGKWSEFENTQFPIIKKIEIDKIIQQGNNIEINVETNDADSILYFVIDSQGKIQSTGELEINQNKTVIKITSEESKKLQLGANSIKIFAISNSVLKPDFYESSFLVSENNLDEPKIIVDTSNIKNEINYDMLIVGIIVMIAIILIVKYLKNQSKP